MAISRRRLLRQTAGAVATAGLLRTAGIYGLIDGLVTMPARVDAANAPAHPEQHLIDGIQTITDNGVLVNIPPLYHQVVTAKLTVRPGDKKILDVQKKLEDTLEKLDDKYPNTPAGLNFVVAWGLPYFNGFVPGPWADLAPVDNRATASNGQKTLAVIDAIPFPSDPTGITLEANDVAIVFASDVLDNIEDASSAIFDQHKDIFQMTSIRKGFVGGGFGGGRSLPKQMALAAGIPGAGSIPDKAELFLGFTSTQQAALGPGEIANLETLNLPGLGNLTDQWPNGYFCYGTTMHLSHLFEDLVAWYTAHPDQNYGNRVQRMFNPHVSVPAGTLTVPNGPAQVESLSQVEQDAQNYALVGHNGSLQPISRLPSGVLNNHDGTTYPAGTPVPQRADFDTLDNPFATPAGNGYAAGLHFVVFAPTSDAFHRTRMGMDGNYSHSGVNLANAPYNINPRSPGMGFNAVLSTTHRQNWLVPPRAHRSFPLAELLTPPGPGSH